MIGVEEGREFRLRGDLYTQQSTFPLVTDVAWSVTVCLLVMNASGAESAEPIEMPFGVRTRVEPTNHVRWGPGPPRKKGKVFHTRYRALDPELIPVYRQSARR